MKSKTLKLSINITRSEESKRVYLDWTTADGNVGGSFDVTDLVLLAMESAKSDAVRELVEFVKNNWNEAPNEMLENLKHKAREMGVNVTDL
jgi:hypothetical protein